MPRIHYKYIPAQKIMTDNGAITYSVDYLVRDNRVGVVSFSAKLNGRYIFGVSMPATKFTRDQWLDLANQPVGARYTVNSVDPQYFIHRGDPMIVVVYGVAGINIPLSAAADKLREMAALEFDEDRYPPPVAPPTK